MIGSSYQSSLTPRSTRWSGLIDPLTKQTLLAIRSSYQSSLTPLINQKKIVLIGSSFQSSLSPRSTNPLNLWLTDKTFCTFSRLLGRQTNFSRSGALIRAYWHPINQKRLAIRSSYQSSLTPWSTNKHVMIGSSYQSSLTPRSTRWSGLIDPLIDQKLLAIRSSYQSSLIPWSSNKLLDIGGSYQSLFPPWLIRVSLRSGACIRAQWLKNWSTTLFRSGALARAHWLFVEQQERLQTHSYW